MQSLLRWGIENSGNDDGSATDAVPLARRTDFDPGIIDAILGRPDSELMKEALANAQDVSLDEDTRLTALDNLEMLVENIDNANDLEKLGMWAPLQDLLAAPSNDIKVQALWVIGTAMQNNPAAQKAYLAIDPFPAVISYLSPSTQSSQQLRSKAIYALSGLLKHNAAAIAPFGLAGGWEALRGALSDSDIGVRRKAAFLLNSLLMPAIAVPVTAATTTTTTTTVTDSSGVEVHGGPESQSPAASIVHPNSHASMVADPASVDTAPETLRALHTHGLLPVLVQELTEPTPYGPDGDEGDGSDADLEEKLTRLLYTYVSAHDGTFDGPEKASLRAFLESKEVSGGQGEVMGLAVDELKALKKALT